MDSISFLKSTGIQKILRLACMLAMSAFLSACTIPSALKHPDKTFCVYDVDPPVEEGCEVALMEKEIEELQCQVEEGHIYAAVNLGHMYLTGEGVPKDLCLAHQWYKKAAEGGISVAAVQMGHFYRDGCAVPRDVCKAIAWYTRAANLGDVAGMIALGELYRGWHGADPDRSKAIQWYVRAAGRGSSEAEYQLAVLLSHSSKKAGMSAGVDRLIALAGECHPEAMAALGDLYYEGRLGKKDHTKAYDYWCRSAKLGSGLGAFKLGMLYTTGECVEQDYKNAVKWFVISAEKGFPEAEMFLGNLYRDGRGVPKNYKIAAHWYARAVSHGYIAANVELADLYHAGKGVPRYLEEAVRHYTVAAESGDPYAALMLSVMYEDARGVPHDFCKSVAYYDFASSQPGYLLGLYKMGRRFATGFGLPRNMHDAIKWYCRAANCGLTMAQVELADLYYSGECLPQDFGKAYEWYHKAAVQGHTYAQNMLGLILLEGDCLPKYAHTYVPGFKAAGKMKALCCNTCNQVTCICEPAYSERAGNACPMCLMVCAARCLEVTCRCNPKACCTCGARYAYRACNQMCNSRHKGCGPVPGRCTVAISPENARLAARWIRKAAVNGAGQAQFQLGILYMTGIGVPKDEAKAYAWMQTGLECMDDQPPDVINCLIHRMCPEDKHRAVYLAERYRCRFKKCPQLPQRY